MEAAGRGHEEAVKLLLEKEADPNAKIDEELTVLQLVEVTNRCKEDRSEIVKLLRAHRAKE